MSATTSGRRLVDRYRLLDLLGQGGMAVVHRAHDEQLGRDVAVKLLRPAFSHDPEFVRRFRVEARNAAALVHPNVAAIYDWGSDGDDDFIVMQLVDGPDLEQVIAARGRLDAAAAVDVGIGVADALAAAHAAGIVHRDIKPGNVLIDGDGTVRVVDFGIARASHDTTATVPGMTFGSIHYASPEQVTGEPITPSSDIYSLGLVLYEALTGRRPFDGDTPPAVALARLRVDPVPPSRLAPHVPPALDALVMRALARRPEDRYASAIAFGDALRTWRVERLGTTPDGPAAALAPLAVTTARRPRASASPTAAVATSAAGGGAGAGVAGGPRPAVLGRRWLVPVAILAVAVASGSWALSGAGGSTGAVDGTTGQATPSYQDIVPPVSTATPVPLKAVSQTTTQPTAKPVTTKAPSKPAAPKPKGDRAGGHGHGHKQKHHRRGRKPSVRKRHGDAAPRRGRDHKGRRRHGGRGGGGAQRSAGEAAAAG
jgi:eukaryotic-like serine/threonine-protein kinase